MEVCDDVFDKVTFIKLSSLLGLNRKEYINHTDEVVSGLNNNVLIYYAKD